MSRLSVAVDDKLVEEVMRLSGAKTKKAALELALAEYARRKSLEELAGLAGSGLVTMTHEELEQWRTSKS
jgi:Arc/MetJ family transcription regulator